MSKKIEGDLPPLILLEDLGMRFPTKNSKERKRFGRYQCGFCGNEFKVQIQSINTGATKSCGCYQKRRISEVRKTHGLSNTRLNRIWRNIKGRTLNPKNKQYNYYGGRGTTICDEWKNDFMSFYAWAISNGYSDELSIDRIDNDGGYSPENCRWATKTIQSRNTRIQKNNTSGYRGVSYFKRDGNYLTYINIKSKRIHLGYFQTAEDGAVAYNNYIIENNLEGFILNPLPNSHIPLQLPTKPQHQTL